MNQITTKYARSGDKVESIIVPALGDSWGHACTNRVILFWKNDERLISLHCT